MLAYGLIAALQELREQHGNVDVVVRHEYGCEFGPDDDIEIQKVFYDAEADKIVIQIYNTI